MINCSIGILPNDHPTVGQTFAAINADRCMPLPRTNSRGLQFVVGHPRHADERFFEQSEITFLQPLLLGCVGLPTGKHRPQMRMRRIDQDIVEGNLQLITDALANAFHMRRLNEQHITR